MAAARLAAAATDEVAGGGRVGMWCPWGPAPSETGGGGTTPFLKADSMAGVGMEPPKGSVISAGKEAIEVNVIQAMMYSTGCFFPSCSR